MSKPVPFDGEAVHFDRDVVNRWITARDLQRKERRKRERLWELAQRGAALGVGVGVLPVVGAMYAAVKLSSPGPFLFRQARRGLHGERFEVLKVRTMTVGSDRKADNALGVRLENPEITAVGRLLRDLKLDELPQLWNVIRGDMNLVGPRPIPLALEDALLRQIPKFAQRWSVKPGLTNVAQVSVLDNALGDQLIEDWTTRFEAELHYLEHRSPSYDLVLLGLTGLFVLKKALRQRPEAAPAKEDPVTPAAPAATSTRGHAATEILGIPVSDLNYAGVLDKIAGWIAAKERRYVGVTPVHSLVEAQWNPAHKRALQGSDLNTADGVPVAWTQRLLGYREASRVYGPTLMLEALARAEREGWRMAFYGGHPERLPVLLERLRARFPRLQIVSAISPPFRKLTEDEDAAHVAELEAAQPDITWVGLGSPKQEIWMAEHRGRIPGVCVGVGAAFDFHAGAVPQAPPALQKIGMEWAYRLACEPKRLAKRYAKANPTYVALAGAQVLKSWVLRRSCRVQREA